MDAAWPERFSRYRGWSDQHAERRRPDRGAGHQSEQPNPSGGGGRCRLSGFGHLPVDRWRCELDTGAGRRTDRKSTRLNSSHLVISYAVFCLKKKKKKEI